MEEPNKAVVRIGGREYTMRGFVSEEYIHKVAIYVDKKMEEIEKRQPALSTTMLAVLTAINLADEIMQQREEIERLRQELKELKEMNELNESKGPNKQSERQRTVNYDSFRKGRR